MVQEALFRNLWDLAFVNSHVWLGNSLKIPGARLKEGHELDRAQRDTIYKSCELTVGRRQPNAYVVGKIASSRSVRPPSLVFIELTENYMQG